MLAIGLTTLVAVFGQTYILQNVYIATLDWFPGFMFLLVAGLNVACCFLLLWMDYVEKPDERVFKVDEIIEEEVREVRSGTRFEMQEKGGD